MDSNALSIVTFNMHGFNQGHSTLDHLSSISELNVDIILLQEHWLTPDNLHKIKHFSSRYTAFGISAMENDVSHGVLRGRPRGGVCSLIKSNYASAVTFNACTERYVVVCIGQLLVINVYFPTISSDRDLCTVQSMFAELDTIMERFPNHKKVFGGDFNVNLDLISDNNNIFYHFLFKFNVASCSRFINSNLQFTYCHDSLQHYSYIDFICISNDICMDLLEFKVLDLPFNLSDHYPVYVRLSIDHIDITGGNVNSSRPTQSSGQCFQSRLRWDHANMLPLYYDCTRELLTPVFNKLTTEYNGWMSSIKESEYMSYGYNEACDYTDSAPFNHLHNKPPDRRIPPQCHNKDSIECTIKLIEDMYERVVCSLNEAASYFIPSAKSNYFKYWWTQEMSDLKFKSCSTHSNWINAGKPKHGPIYDEKRIAKATYKKAIKDNQKFELESVSNDLHDALVNKSSCEFWKSWKNKFGNKNKPPSTIEGLHDSEAIADSFAMYFSSVCNADPCVDNELFADKFYSRLSTYRSSEDNDLCIDIEMIDRIVRKLIKGKAAGFDCLTVEHIQFSHPMIISILSMLFNLFLKFEFTPKAFGRGIIIPIPKKDTKSNFDKLSDYRGITVSPVISKIFELCILDNINDSLTTSDLQYGFKSGLSCSHAIYTVRSTVNYFNAYGSTVNLCSLDVTKAFDRVNHHVLFLKLMERCLPRNLVILLSKWYSISTAIVRWNMCISKTVKILAGVRQGGVLSPLFFSIFVDDIFAKLKSAGFGCQIRHEFFNAIMYADDLLLLANSLSDLQAMINICVHEFSAIGLSINTTKSACMRIGPRFKAPVANVFVGNLVIPWKSEIKFLGVNLLAASTVKCNLQVVRQKYFRALNAVFGKIGTRSSVSVTLSLISSFCVPLLTYGIEAFSVSQSMYNVLESAYSAAFSKIFWSFDKNVIAQCQVHCTTSPLCNIIDIKRLKFLYGISKLKRGPLKSLFLTEGVNEFHNLLSKHSLTTDSVNSWKHCLWSNFCKSVE